MFFKPIEMTDQECVWFLKWSLPQLEMRWNGFRKVRAQVCSRIDRRLRHLGLPDAPAYRALLENDGTEWDVLDSLCRVTISRFYRDQEVFRSLEEVLALLGNAVIARGGSELRCWSIGCASGEEPYSLAIAWNLGPGRLFPTVTIAITATDSDPDMIARAQEGCYQRSSIRNVPRDRIAAAFIRDGDRFCIRPGEREKVVFLEQDIRTAEPEGLFDLVLCRNIVFTYFDASLQKKVLARLHEKLRDPGALVTGIHEALPRDAEGFAPWSGCRVIYRKL